MEADRYSCDAAISFVTCVLNRSSSSSDGPFRENGEADWCSLVGGNVVDDAVGGLHDVWGDRGETNAAAATDAIQQKKDKMFMA
mmetsp:Transcript_3749/g.9563  ORF Transcript_3749/g.9563 Transcript_3749/m.9563 type:complete len:84 (-) Transcript_3749:88-339(-)